MLHRIFGLETEYGLLVNEDQPDHSPTWFAHKIRDHLFHVQRRGVLDLHHRGHDEPPGNGDFSPTPGACISTWAIWNGPHRNVNR